MYYGVVGTLVVLVLVRRLIAYRRRQERPPNYGPTYLKGKVCIITGATSGIGVYTAKAIAGMGAHVILACRNVPAGKKVAEEIIRATNNKKVEVMHLELNSFKEVRKFVEEFKERKLPLNILINNAAANVHAKYYTTPDGNELQLQVNHLSHFLLTNLLLDKLKDSQPSRIINVASHSHYRCKKLDWDNLNGERYQPGMQHFYEQSKLCNVLFTHELQRRLQASGKTISANSLHPGSIMYTGLFEGSDFPLYIKFVVVLLWLLGISKTQEEGAWTTIIAAADPLYTHNGGLYLSGNTWKPASKYSKDPAVAKKLWEVSAKLTGLEK